MLIVITGPSGVGKTTIIKSLLDLYPDLKYSVSMTTRQPRHNEKNGVDYHFVSEEEFKSRIEKDEFIEWSEVYGKYYGRLKKDLEDPNSDILIGIDVKGALKLKRTHPQAVFIFILPRSEEALEMQLRGRGTESESSLKARLDSAIHEMDKADEFDYKVINDDVNEAVKKIMCIIVAEKCHTRRSNLPKK